LLSAVVLAAGVGLASAALADAVEAAVARQLATLPRGAVAAAAWRDIADPAPYVAVNVSPVQLADPAFPATVARALAEAGLRPSSLELEVTESVLTVDPDAASARLAALRGLGVAIASAVGMIRARARADEAIRRLSTDKADLRVALDRAEALLDAEDQVLLAWGAADEPPILTGALGPAAGAPPARPGFLAFGAWLTPASAADLDRRIAALRDRGTPFTIELTTQTRTFVEACGRIGGGRPFVRFRDLTTERIEFARSREAIETLRDERDTLRGLFDRL
ncbi:EAL domain-containing protein, partial [Mycobacterium tuberculosis]|nr:EAL domain-containing protein [Mycobacterium tuberculosis]